MGEIVPKVSTYKSARADREPLQTFKVGAVSSREDLGRTDQAATAYQGLIVEQLEHQRDHEGDLAHLSLFTADDELGAISGTVGNGARGALYWR